VSKGVVVAYFSVLSQPLLGATEQKLRKTSINLAGFWDDIWNRGFSFRKQKW